MNEKKFGLSRRSFFGGLAAAIGALGLTPRRLFAQRAWTTEEEYDALAKLSSNENPYGPFDSALEAMNHAFKYANRYGYPDGNIQEDAIAKHHGVERENILLGAGSGEILKVVGTAYLLGQKKVIGVEPTFSSVYSARHRNQGRLDQAPAPRRLHGRTFR